MSNFAANAINPAKTDSSIFGKKSSFHQILLFIRKDSYEDASMFQKSHNKMAQPYMVSHCLFKWNIYHSINLEMGRNNIAIGNTETRPKTIPACIHFAKGGILG